jgi:hypothetical protein
MDVNVQQLRCETHKYRIIQGDARGKVKYSEVTKLYTNMCLNSDWLPRYSYFNLNYKGIVNSFFVFGATAPSGPGTSPQWARASSFTVFLDHSR